MTMKTGEVIKDELKITSDNETSIFKIHFPTNSLDRNIIGTDVEISLDTLKELQTKLNDKEFSPVKKAGTDKLLITNENVLGVYRIYFPKLSLDSEVTGTTVELSSDDYQLLIKKVNRIIYWTCPRCGKGLHNYRRSELDWDYLRCEYCNWNEQDNERGEN